MMMLYDILFAIFSIVYLPVFIIKGKHRHGLSQRFGRIPQDISASLKGKKVFWIHAVSVGEVALAVRFSSAVKIKDPGAKVVLTTTTMAGWEVASRSKDKEDTLLYFPIDFKFSVRSFIHHIHPNIVIILETEIWPNLLRELSLKHIPVFIINGRLSNKGMASYKRIRFFLKRILGMVSGIGVQDEQMKERFIALGARPDRIFITGNIKYDIGLKNAARDATAALQDRLKSAKSFWLVAGSTHDNEEEMLFDLYRELQTVCPGQRLLIAPRHLDRIPSIQAKAAQKKIPVALVSSLSQNGAVSHAGEDTVLLLDQMGTLAAWYGLADVVFVGGSLVPTGGHNLVEPALCEKAILFGPHMDNFKPMSREFMNHGAAIQVRNAVDLKNQVEYLYQNQEKRMAMGLAAKSIVLSHQGSVQKNIELVWGGLNH